MVEVGGVGKCTGVGVVDGVGGEGQEIGRGGGGEGRKVMGGNVKEQPSEPHSTSSISYDVLYL